LIYLIIPIYLIDFLLTNELFNLLIHRSSDEWMVSHSAVI